MILYPTPLQQPQQQQQQQQLATLGYAGDASAARELDALREAFSGGPGNRRYRFACLLLNVVDDPSSRQKPAGELLGPFSSWYHLHMFAIIRTKSVPACLWHCFSRLAVFRRAPRHTALCGHAIENRLDCSRLVLTKPPGLPLNLQLTIMSTVYIARPLA